MVFPPERRIFLYLHGECDYIETEHNQAGLESPGYPRALGLFQQPRTKVRIGCNGGEAGIRTRGPRNWDNCLAGSCLKPLGHLSYLWHYAQFIVPHLARTWQIELS